MQRVGRRRKSARTLLLATVWLAAMLPACAARLVTVEQLEQLLVQQTLAHKSDGSTANALRGLELTERLTPTSLARIVNSRSPGRQSAEELKLLVMKSSLLAPPQSELPRQPMPDSASLQALWNAANHFQAVTLRHLPDFLATRVTHNYDNIPMNPNPVFWKSATMHLDGSSSQEITYRNGAEVPTQPEAKPKQANRVTGLYSKGEFGPILTTVMLDLVKGRMTWGRWEQAATGPAVVFYYAVPEASSHFKVKFSCCVEDERFGRDAEIIAFDGAPAYHGEITVDPATGNVLRVTFVPELHLDSSDARSGIAVDYGQVTIGEKSFNCPVQSVAILSIQPNRGPETMQARSEWINQVDFVNYHRFGATVKLRVGP
jgi:hypothetical protein